MDVCIQSYNGKQALKTIKSGDTPSSDYDFDEPYPENMARDNLETKTSVIQNYLSDVESDNVLYMGGCTSVVVFIKNDNIYCANAGDSRCVLSRNNIAYPLSSDHKPDHDNERERIYNGGGTVEDGRVNGNLNLSRSIGDVEYKLNKNLPAEKQIITAFPDIVEETLTDKDIIILACDGIWDCMSNQMVVDFVNEKLTYQE